MRELTQEIKDQIRADVEDEYSFLPKEARDLIIASQESIYINEDLEVEDV